MIMYMKSILFTIFISLYFFCFGQNAVQLDGINDIVTVNYPGILGNNARTVEAWIKTSSNYNPNTQSLHSYHYDHSYYLSGPTSIVSGTWILYTRPGKSLDSNDIKVLRWPTIQQFVLL